MFIVMLTLVNTTCFTFSQSINLFFVKHQEVVHIIFIKIVSKNGPNNYGLRGGFIAFPPLLIFTYKILQTRGLQLFLMIKYFMYILNIIDNHPFLSFIYMLLQLVYVFISPLVIILPEYLVYLEPKFSLEVPAVVFPVLIFYLFSVSASLLRFLFVSSLQEFNPVE